MEQPVTQQPRSEVRRPKKECCTDLQCESGLRNNYFEGKRLTADMFKVEQRFLAERRHLLNRAMYGTGVVYGYGIEAGALKESAGGLLSRRLRIRSGLAFDPCGRELLQVGGRPLDLADVLVIDENGKQLDADETFAAASKPYRPSHRKPADSTEPVCWLLSVHYAEQRDGSVTVPDPCECDRHEWERTCETVRYTLQRIDCDKCCVDDECGLDCGCGTGYCCEPRRRHHREPVPPEKPDKKEKADFLASGAPLEAPAPAAADRIATLVGKHPDPAVKTEEPDPEDEPDLPFRRGGCRCLCDHLIDLPVEDTCSSRLVEIDEACGRVLVDLKHGVALACLGLVPDDCGGWTFGETIDPCGPRHLIKRNDLLFDLIRGCDLTRLSDISWHAWHRHRKPIAFDDFVKAFGDVGDDPLEYETQFSVTFSRPVNRNTVKADCFAMTIMSFEAADRGWQTVRVPILRVITSDVDPQSGDPEGYVRSARLVVGRAWVEDGLNGWGGPFNGETWVEIEVRGDFILDCNGQPVDANAVGRVAVPTGNGTPGGTFLSSFRVAPRPPQVRGGRYDHSDRKGASS